MAGGGEADGPLPWVLKHEGRFWVAELLSSCPQAEPFKFGNEFGWTRIAVRVRTPLLVKFGCCYVTKETQMFGVDCFVLFFLCL